MTAELTVICVGPGGANNPTHKRWVVADLLLDPPGTLPGIYLKPTAQQRGSSSATRPRPLGRAGGPAPLFCTKCGGQPLEVSQKRLRLWINRCAAAGESEVYMSMFC